MWSPTNPRPKGAIYERFAGIGYRQEYYDRVNYIDIDEKFIREHFSIRRVNVMRVSVSDPGYREPDERDIRVFNTEMSSEEIVKTPSVFPYTITPRTRNKLQKKSSAFQEVCLRLATSSIVARLYRITNYAYCDEAGRIYKYTPATHYRKFKIGVFEFVPFSITEGRSYRNFTTLHGPGYSSFTTSAYRFIGVCGLHPDIQSEIIFSDKFDVHHIGENLFDYRPSALLPLPVDIHRWVHHSDFDKYKNFFSMSNEFNNIVEKIKSKQEK